ncbi:phospholipase a2 [Plakobranchus ocellatus]|uniref:Phospholipase a2 n=1 Tax=Plakobranchus ocellatus TaxID=259542 RepID=A0AAV4CVE7_9GAST|nr:phospholipase a2 [Plakobranchus ocellatus]
MLSPFLKSQPASDIMEVDSDTVHKMAVGCSGVISGVGSKEHIVEKRSPFDILKGIYPGTKWCGKGNAARSYGDLGSYRRTDMCCREHDHCPHTIRARGRRYELYNPSPFTRSSCACDNRLRRCLQRVNSFEARTIIFLFFDVAKMRCFYLRH